MHMIDEETAVPDSLRRWAALYSLWNIGAREEAQRLADSFVGCKASLCAELGEDEPVTLTHAYVSNDHSAPGGISITFDWMGWKAPMRSAISRREASTVSRTSAGLLAPSLRMRSISWSASPSISRTRMPVALVKAS